MEFRALARLGSVVACLASIAPAWALDADVQGISGRPADNIAIYLGGLDAAQYSQSRLESVVRRRSMEALRVYGYYEPQLQLAFAGDPVERVTVMVEAGPQVVIQSLNFQVRGEARRDETFVDALEAFPLSEGDPLEHAPYDRLRNRLSALSLERGYFDSRFLDRRMEVRPWEQSARLYLTLDSGPRYRFGEPRFHGSHIDEDRLRRMLPFEPGDPYLAGDIARYNQRLGQSNWFSSISVRPRVGGDASLALDAPAGPGWWQQADLQGEGAPASPPADTPVEGPMISAQTLAAVRSVTPQSLDVPIDVTLVPADRHQFEVGVGYATDVGPRLRFGWQQPWINRLGHSLNHDLFLSGPEQRFTGEYAIPLEDPLRDSYRLQYGFRHRDSDDTRSLEASVELARRWEFENGWVQSAYLRSTFEDFTQGVDEDQTFLLYPGISWSRTRTRNPRFPSWGDRQRVAIEYSNTAWGSDIEFFRSTADSQWIRMLGRDNRFIGRVGLGSVETSEFERMPPSLRFFTGGDRSVRGYAYESLAPRDEEGALLGGQQLFTASLEYQRRVTGDWWGATFIDTGDAFDDWGPDQLNTGAGLGVRWISPVGPIRFDVAHPFDDDENDWRIHFAIGPEF
ncbi:autotransporter assembly complex family protein [Franzmannia qiaohouensis]|uniref:Translocation and assembly module subunit TamA n=1 Tax=Franzmannia qiaohouensis TaxID=1329370 RepID=A0ABU1HH19_9GAMM|nr:autotransporter assembly complex family protein [Halomonas qiaohouensis]MDR5905880.1 autotransporter assembly complex protein TamA [Halomonas qiaohouensis]